MSKFQICSVTHHSGGMWHGTAKSHSCIYEWFFQWRGGRIMVRSQSPMSRGWFLNLRRPKPHMRVEIIGAIKAAKRTAALKAA